MPFEYMPAREEEHQLDPETIKQLPAEIIEVLKAPTTKADENNWFARTIDPFFGGAASKEKDEVLELLPEEEAEKFCQADPNTVIRMLHETIGLVWFCGLGNFAFAPLGYLCGRITLLPVLGVGVLVLGQIAWGAVVQQRILHTAAPLASYSRIAILRGISNFHFHTPPKEELDRALGENRDPQKTAMENFSIPLLGLTLCFPTWILAVCRSLPEYFDPTTDAYTAGVAHNSLTSTIRKEFAESWRGVMWKWGDLIAMVNLEGVLIVIVSVTWIVQFLNFTRRLKGASRTVAHLVDRMHFLAKDLVLIKNQGADLQTQKKTIKWRMGESLWTFWCDIDTAAENASIGVVSLLNPAGVKERFVTGQYEAGCEGALELLKPWLNKVLFKVLMEALPSSWFTVSLLALTIDDMEHTQVVTTVLSVVVSLCSIIHVLIQPRTSHSKVIGTVGMCISFPILFPLIIVAVRFIGVFLCPSHQWALTSAGCVA
mmetsp:Transcript_46897/g.84702  ORF Transcript_46897/g.84702 Transcript_46897/m.84702 type:complete len:486 (+) Transcript_46897:69-1526(+)